MTPDVRPSAIGGKKSQFAVQEVSPTSQGGSERRPMTTFGRLSAFRERPAAEPRGRSSRRKRTTRQRSLAARFTPVSRGPARKVRRP